MWGDVSPEEVRDRVLEYFQASSSLSFAANGQEFTDLDLDELHTRAGDYVSVAMTTAFNANVSEGGRQHHKKHNKSGSSRDPPAHHARSTNAKLALMRLETRTC
ncbi:unnamed protein product [Ectocarpus sp. CCAP 1310/34]|nr:unnamed protein product [Ectocarpus sp. CCAP 1310/34]